MKQLIFIDNDSVQRSSEDVRLYVVPYLQQSKGLENVTASDIKIVSDLYKREREEVYNLLFSGKNAVVSWSVYAPTAFHDSYRQLLNFLRVAGSADVSNAIYIDASGNLLDALRKIKYDDAIKGVVHILTAIERNNIITLDGGKFMMLKLDLASSDMFKFVDVDLAKVLEV